MDFTTVEGGNRPSVRDKQNRTYELMGPDGHISFGDVSRNLLGKQCQYGSRYIDGQHATYPNLAVGLRVNLDLWQGQPSGDYHRYTIHPEDVDELLSRWTAWQAHVSGQTNDGPDTPMRPLNDQEREEIEAYLERVGAIPAETE